MDGGRPARCHRSQPLGRAPDSCSSAFPGLHSRRDQLGGISAIADAHLGIERAVITFVLFVALAHAVSFDILALVSSSSSRSAAILEGFRAWLERNNRLITIMFGLVFGTWFLLKALTRLGLV